MSKIQCIPAFLCLFLSLATGFTSVPIFIRYKTGVNRANYKYETKYFDQKIDHFAFPNPGTFKMRYLVNDVNWNRTNGPIFFYTGNEGDITAFADNTGFMWDIAPEYGAKIVFAEHRYYGESMPFGKQSYEKQNLRYFTSEQALADYAFLLETINPEKRAVILFGGSYGGMLAAWMRMKYPHLVAGAIAASAPIWQFQGLTQCGVFNQIVTRDFASANKNCVTNVRKSWDTMDDYATTGEGRRQLTGILRLCKPLQPNDIPTMKVWLLNVYGNLAMVNYPYATSFLEPLPPWPVKAFCEHLSTLYDDTKLLEQLAMGLNVYFNSTGTTKCFDINSQSTGGVDDLGWDYQACTEMVMPMCADGKTDMFQPYMWDLVTYSADCQSKWGVVPDPDWVITHYGDRRIEASSNIVFSNGDLDPWSGGGVLKTLAPSLPAIRIPFAAHHLDLRADNPSDTVYVRSARLHHKHNITKWINEWNRPAADTTLRFRAKA